MCLLDESVVCIYEKTGQHQEIGHSHLRCESGLIRLFKSRIDLNYRYILYCDGKNS